ncbi:zinc c6 transcription factor [Ophiostoma piceae UAMH 11346]|uniref:Zinc c6 transcription factor n=1 Tax=Ophiostoma piceae (strain UAMH 11346) TaxID=1262450 RepID=S3C310_OPHP1|nr:zinc c6 transcription factor [Ophiostoma piceae UAMH 11346]
MGEYGRQCLILGLYVNVDKCSMDTSIVLLQIQYLLPNSQLTPFDAEMRRRIWVTVFEVDLLISFQIGLPSMVPWDYCDTELLRNLEYGNLSPGITSLPPSRPLTDSTPILYTIVKARIISIFKSIVGHTRSLVTRPYGDTMTLDADLQHAYARLPENFKYRPLDQCLIDTAKEVMNRTTIKLLYLKSIIVCIVVLHQPSQPGSLFYDSQRMMSTLTANDFILATMVVCLEITICIIEDRKPRSASGVNRFSAHEPDILSVTLKTFLDNNYNDPLDRTLDFDSWMVDATKGPAFMDLSPNF